MRLVPIQLLAQNFRGVHLRYPNHGWEVWEIMKAHDFSSIFHGDSQILSTQISMKHEEKSIFMFFHTSQTRLGNLRCASLPIHDARVQCAVPTGAGPPGCSGTSCCSTMGAQSGRLMTDCSACGDPDEVAFDESPQKV